MALGSLVDSRLLRHALMLCAALAAGAVAPPGAAAGAPAACVGDCDGNGRVTVVELILGVHIVLGDRSLEACPVFDADGDGLVGVHELTASVARLFFGCLAPAPSPTPSATPTASHTSTPPHGPTGSPSATPSGTATLPAEPTGSRTATASPTATPSPSPTSSATPTISPTRTPIVPPPVSTRVCGDGVRTRGEECDDHNTVPDDGCSALCRIEPAPDPCAGVQPVSGTRLSAVRVASGLSNPLFVTAPPGDTERVFIVEQRGRIRILTGGRVLATPFLDISARVASGGELGLLGLAFHPLYGATGELFIYYTTRRDGVLWSVVSRLRVSADPNVADPASEEVILEQFQPFAVHKGGQLAFDAAGYLYISFGDGGQSASGQNNGQDPTTWLAKILRIDVDGGTPYAVPPSNPFVGPDGVRDEILVSGLRNPWRFSIDRGSGDLYIGDVGEQRREEIDVVPAGSAGQNFGWCCREGTEAFSRCFAAATTCPSAGLVEPVLDYPHEEGCSVTGGFVYQGCALPDLRGTYFYGDYCTAFVRSFRLRDGVAQEQHDWTAELAPADGTTIDRIAGFGEDGRGELYICDLLGEVFKLVPAP